MSSFDQSPSYAVAHIVEENGQWVVYLSVTFWEYEDEPRLRTYRSRIDHYPTRRHAEIAAHWIAQNANRDIPDPPSGF